MADDITREIPSAKRIIEAHEGMAKPFGNAEAFLKAGDYAQAIPLLEEARGLAAIAYADWGSTPAVEVMIGECFERTGKPEQAKDAYRKAISIMGSFESETLVKPAFQSLMKSAQEGLKRLK